MEQMRTCENLSNPSMKTFPLYKALFLRVEGFFLQSTILLEKVSNRLQYTRVKESG